MDIAQLVPDDWAMFRALRIAALSEAPYAFGSTLDGEQRLGEADWRIRRATRAQFVARDAGSAAVGTVGAYRDGEMIELVSMWVAPAVRGRGVGAALVERVVAHARELDCREVRLWVTEGNAAAERLYACRCALRLRADRRRSADSPRRARQRGRNDAGSVTRDERACGVLWVVVSRWRDDPRRGRDLRGAPRRNEDQRGDASEHEQATGDGAAVEADVRDRALAGGGDRQGEAHDHEQRAAG